MLDEFLSPSEFVLSVLLSGSGSLIVSFYLLYKLRSQVSDGLELSLGLPLLSVGGAGFGSSLLQHLRTSAVLKLVEPAAGFSQSSVGFGQSDTLLQAVQKSDVLTGHNRVAHIH